MRRFVTRQPALTDMLLRFSHRERRLIGLLLVAVLPLSTILLILLPLAEARVAASQTRDDARDLLNWIETQAAAYPEATAPEAPAKAERASLAALESALVSAGLRQQVTTLGNRGTNQVEIRFDSASFTDVMDWLTGQQAQTGFALSSLIVEDLPSAGQVTVSLVLEPAS
ncbi:type II secretion system protein M [Ferrimonas balearica]|nr:type II secretion system protein M [Ferrimonas balearica]